MRGLMQERPLLLAGLLEHAGRYHGGTEIVSRQADGGLHRYGYAEAAARARRLARALARLGLKPGEAAGSLAFNHFRHFELFYGVSGSGAVLHTANPRLPPEQILYTLLHSGDRLLFVDPHCLDLAAALAPQVPGLRQVVVMAGRNEMPADRLAGALCYEELLAAEDDGFDWPSFDENTASVICYTSGTTGQPKGVVYSHRASVLQAYIVASGNGFALSSRDAALPVASMYHVNGWSMPYAAAMAGCKLVLPGRQLEAPALLELIRAEQVSIALGVPTIFLSLLEHLRQAGGDLKPLARIACGGSAPPRAMMEQLWREHGVSTIHAWGMTETTGGVTFFLPRGNDRLDDFDLIELQGRPAYGSELRIADEAGKPLPWDGQAVGEVQARGNFIAAGYRDQPPFADGWLPTGDVGCLTPDGTLKLTDRAKDVIKSGGEWISSIALENAAVGHPAVAEAGVIAVAHPKWQERPLLVAVKTAGAQVDKAELRAFLAERMPRWWLPDDIVFVAALPHTATGKIQKSELRRQFADYRLPDGGQ